MSRYYTGVGSRQTPPEILTVMRRLAKKFSDLGWTLRSGGAQGADTAFASGARKAEIFRPEHATQSAMDLAASVHPAWHRCSEYAKRLHARNCFQVLGWDLQTPSSMLICWTCNGAKVGGTATAIRLAEKFQVPVRNLAKKDTLAKAIAWLES